MPKKKHSGSAPASVEKTESEPRRTALPGWDSLEIVKYWRRHRYGPGERNDYRIAPRRLHDDADKTVTEKELREGEG